ncbi:MAG: hypothetical protein K6T26_06035 [Alicyclobacillus sp.]|nr:hypothetical protein [Alicyclobacillus sp.]
MRLATAQAVCLHSLADCPLTPVMGGVVLDEQVRVCSSGVTGWHGCGKMRPD